MKLYTAQEVAKDIQNTELFSRLLDIPGLENARFFKLYSQAIKAPLQGLDSKDLQELVTLYYSALNNVVPKTNIEPDFNFLYNIYALESVPDTLFQLYETEARFVLKTNSGEVYSQVFEQNRHAFYIMVCTAQMQTLYFDQGRFKHETHWL